MLFYESAKCLHGRMQKLRGKYYGSIFLHYSPVDKGIWNYSHDVSTAFTPFIWLCIILFHPLLICYSLCYSLRFSFCYSFCFSLFFVVVLLFVFFILLLLVFLIVSCSLSLSPSLYLPPSLFPSFCLSLSLRHQYHCSCYLNFNIYC
jgi:hypothetical protein